MGDKYMNMVLYWGDKVITRKHGASCKMQHKTGIRLKEGTKYKQLLDKVYSVMALHPSPSSALKLTCRCPRYLGPNGLTYLTIGIDDDESLTFVKGVYFDTPSIIMIDLYAKIVCMQNSTQSVPQCIKPVTACEYSTKDKWGYTSDDEKKHRDEWNAAMANSHTKGLFLQFSSKFKFKYASLKESLAKLPSFMAAIQLYNPGTIHELSTKEDSSSDFRVFEKNFWAFNASIEGFLHCRPVISVDAAKLRGGYMGIILLAVALDANGTKFPLAFGFAEEENADTWRFFLEKLWAHVVKDRVGVCLITDSHAAIIEVVNSGDPNFLAPKTYHRFCMNHVCSNLSAIIKENKLKPKLKKLFWKAAKANQSDKFLRYMYEIENLDTKVESEENKPGKWLCNNIPLEKWTLLYDGGHRYGITDSSASEAFGSTSRLLGDRKLAVTTYVEFIYRRMVDWFDLYREPAVKCKANPRMRYAPFMESKLKRLKSKALKHTSTEHDLSSGTSTVITCKGHVQTVNVQERTCSCGKWDIYKYPCSHAFAVYADLKKDPPFDSLDWYYSLELYVSTWDSRINPVLDEENWPHVSGPVLIPDCKVLRQNKYKRRRISYGTDSDYDDE